MCDDHHLVITCLEILLWHYFPSQAVGVIHQHVYGGTRKESSGFVDYSLRPKSLGVICFTTVTNHVCPGCVTYLLYDNYLSQMCCLNISDVCGYHVKNGEEMSLLCPSARTECSGFVDYSSLPKSLDACLYMCFSIVAHHISPGFVAYLSYCDYLSQNSCFYSSEVWVLYQEAERTLALHDYSLDGEKD